MRLIARPTNRERRGAPVLRLLIDDGAQGVFEVGTTTQPKRYYVAARDALGHPHVLLKTDQRRVAERERDEAPGRIESLRRRFFPEDVGADIDVRILQIEDE